MRLRLRALLRPRAMERELDEELRYHLDREIERHIACGMTPEPAAAAARRAFGNTTQLREEVRDSWGRRWVERIEQDTRYALRSFRRAPVFSVTVVATIALALGLNTTAFTIFDGYVLRPLAVRDPGSLFQLTWVDRRGHGNDFPWTDFEALRADHDAFNESFAFHTLFARVDSVPAFGQLVTGNYFSMLGVGAALGRMLIPADAMPGAPPVLVLSHATWRSQFGGDSAIVGKIIRVRGHPLRVVGVAAPGFGGLGDVPLDFWASLTLYEDLVDGDSLFSSRHPAPISIVARLRPRVTSEQGEAWLTSWVRTRHADAPEGSRPMAGMLQSRATAMPLSPELVLFFAPLAAAFILVLLIACADVANMMLARGLARQRELGIRLSLGAARRRLVAQLLTESVLLALPAALIGFVLSRFTVDAGVRFMFATIPAEVAPIMHVVPLKPDGRIFVFMLVAAVGSALLFGLAPALQATKPNLVQASRGDFDTDFRPQRLRNALVIGQITVCVLLLICAGILLRDGGQLKRLDIGLDTHGIVRLDLQERPGARDRALAVLRERPDVQLIAAASDPPFGGRFPTVTAVDSSQHAHQLSYDFVTASYFSALRVPITRGRSFTDEEERSDAPVAIVSAGTARAFWPGRDPIGQTISLRLDPDDAGQHPLMSRRIARVVGIVPDVVLGTIIDPLESPVVYYPIAARAPGTALLARVAGNTGETMRRIDADLTRRAPASVEDVHTLDAYAAVGLYPFQAASWIAGALGAIALLLTLAGIYGVLSFLVVQRRRELGVRLAVGATPSEVTGLVLAQSLRLAGVGLGIGTLLALGVARLFAANIVGLSTFEPIAFASGAILVMLSSAAAGYVPARRAGRVDPMEALRAE